jgi:hypothetical protein
VWSDTKRAERRASTRWETIWHLIFCPLSARATRSKKNTVEMNLCNVHLRNQSGLYSLRARPPSSARAPRDAHTHQKIRFKGTVCKIIRRPVCFLINQSLNTPRISAWDKTMLKYIICLSYILCTKLKACVNLTVVSKNKHPYHDIFSFFPDCFRFLSFFTSILPLFSHAM